MPGTASYPSVVGARIDFHDKVLSAASFIKSANAQKGIEAIILKNSAALGREPTDAYACVSRRT